MTNWTHYWQRKTVEYHHRRADEGETEYSVLNHTASNLFGPRDGRVNVHNAKVKPGDNVYCISNYGGKFRLLGRLHVENVVNQSTAASKLKTDDLWPARWHLLAEAGTIMPIQFDFVLPQRDVKKIEFISRGGVVNPLFADGRADQQTFRAVRKLSPVTAAMFNASLGVRP